MDVLGLDRAGSDYLGRSNLLLPRVAEGPSAATAVGAALFGREPRVRGPPAPRRRLLPAVSRYGGTP